MTNPTTNTMPVSWLSDTNYNRLKLTAQLLLPALAALYFGLSQIWGLPAGAEVSGSIALVNVFVGVAVAWLKSLHTASGAGTDGELTIVPGEDTDSVRLTSVDPAALLSKDQIVFKVLRPPSA